MNSFRNGQSVPDWKLERYLLGELSREEMERIRLVIEQNPAVKLRLEALEESNRNILESYPASQMSRQILARAAGSQSARTEFGKKRFSAFWPMPALPVAAIIILLAILPALLEREGVDRIGESPVEITRIKGQDPGLMLFRRTASGSEQLEEYTPVRENDRILIQYVPAGRAYGFIFSIDGRGTITRHLPVNSRLAEPLQKDSPVSLDFSYELDDAPDWEKFYFITSDSLFEIETVLSAARIATMELAGAEVGSLGLPGFLEEHTFTLRKADNND